MRGIFLKLFEDYHTCRSFRIESIKKPAIKYLYIMVYPKFEFRTTYLCHIHKFAYASDTTIDSMMVMKTYKKQNIFNINELFSIAVANEFAVNPSIAKKSLCQSSLMTYHQILTY